jgi:ribonuclease J
MAKQNKKSKEEMSQNNAQTPPKRDAEKTKVRKEARGGKAPARNKKSKPLAAEAPAQKTATAPARHTQGGKNRAAKKPLDNNEKNNGRSGAKSAFKAESPRQSGSKKNQSRERTPKAEQIARGIPEMVSQVKDAFRFNKSAEPKSESRTKPARTKKQTVKHSPAHLPTGKLKIIPLGGLNEIGKNMTVIEYENDIIIVDCGLGFPDEEMPGIDLVIPDISYIEANKEKLKGIVLTHGHEDHVGAVPYVLRSINPPYTEQS